MRYEYNIIQAINKVLHILIKSQSTPYGLILCPLSVCPDVLYHLIKSVLNNLKNFKFLKYY